MSGAGRTYTDRFGHVWAVQVPRDAGAAGGVTFTCDRFQLVAVGEEIAETGGRPTASQLKALFCDAERVVSFENELWYVGYRPRTGQGGRVQGGVHTRFRSAGGEVRYSGEMLQFRRMAEEALCTQLAAARPVRPHPTRRS